MKKLLYTLLVLSLTAWVINAWAITVDIRDYIDSGASLASTSTLDAAAQSSDIVWFTGARILSCDMIIADITTNVVVRLQCSNDATNWRNCNVDGSDTTITTDGAYSMLYTYAAIHRYYKLYWVSEAGGTDATIIVSFRVGDKI